MTDSLFMRLCSERYDRKPFEQIKSQIGQLVVLQSFGWIREGRGFVGSGGQLILTVVITTEFHGKIAALKCLLEQ